MKNEADDIEALLDIAALMADANQDNSHRHRRMMTLWARAKEERGRGNYALADQLKAAGNRLLARNARDSNRRVALRRLT